MKITKSSIMHAILSGEEYIATIKYLPVGVLSMISGYYGDDAVQKIRNSGLYEQEPYDEGGLILAHSNLSANVFEQMPNIIAEEELPEVITAYMKENGLWPLEKPIADITRYSIEVALPAFVNAGLLEIVA